ncbi:hypothetical protein Tco_0424356, partial [Tanacetum coccineum]
FFSLVSIQTFDVAAQVLLSGMQASVVPILSDMQASVSPIPFAPDAPDILVPIVVASTVNRNPRIPSFGKINPMRLFSFIDQPFNKSMCNSD